MKVLIKLFQKFAGRGQRPRRLRRGETFPRCLICEANMFFFAAPCSKRTETIFSHKPKRELPMQGSSLMFYIEVISSVLFCASRRKKEPKNAVLECFARCDERRGLRALDLRRLLKKAGENFSRVGVSVWWRFSAYALTSLPVILSAT